ncbi:ferredoxin [Pseudonocardia sp. DLS-67]
MRVDVDRDRCEGHGLCEQVAPGVLELDDDAMARPLHDPVPPSWPAQPNGRSPCAPSPRSGCASDPGCAPG